MRFFTLISAFYMVFFAMQLHALSLNETLIKVYEKNIALRSAMEDKKIAANNRAKAFSSFLPNANLSFKHQHSYDHDKHNDALSLSISEDFSFQKLLYFKGSKQRLQIANLQLAANKQAIFLETIKIYMHILSLHNMLGVSEKKINMLKTSLNAAKTRFDMGNTTKVDVENVKLKLNLAQIENLQIKNNLDISKLQYNNLILSENELHKLYMENEDMSFDFSMPDAHDFIPLPNPETKMANLKLQSMAKNYEIAGTMVKVSETAFFPTLSLQLNRNYVDRDTNKKTNFNLPFFGENIEHSTSLVLQMSFNLLHQGGLDLLNLREAKINRQKAKYDLLDYKLKLHAENRNYWSNLELAQAKQKYVEDAIESAKITLHGITKEYGMGTKNMLDLLSAQQELFNAENELFSAKKDYVIAHYNLVAQANKLTIENIRKAKENM